MLLNKFGLYDLPVCTVTMGAMNNFVRPEQQTCVYVTMCVQYRLLLQWYNNYCTSALANY